MQDGWFVFLILLGALVFAGTLLWFWIARATAANREKEALTATDLRLLEESVEALIGRLTAASDEAVAEIERRQSALQRLLDEVDEKLGEAKARELDLNELRRMADEGVASDEIAQRAGMTRGEVELILELQAARGERR